MKDAVVTVTFAMHNAWSEVDTAETGLSPDEGVHSFLVDDGLSAALNTLASRFGLELRRWGVSVEADPADTSEEKRDG